MESLLSNIRDLRENKQAPDSTIGANVPLYAVVDRKHPGTNGPFFLDPNKALFWAFLVGLSEADNCPIPRWLWNRKKKV